MNRTFFFSIVGLGVLSAAGFAGSRAQHPCVSTCTASSPSAPVVLVTQPDGNCVVARCVAVTACDPKAKKQGSAKAYTFTTQGEFAGGCGSGSTNVTTSSGGLVAIAGSGSGAASCGQGALALPAREGGVATVTVEGDASQVSKRVHRLLEARASAPSALTELEMEPVIVELDGDEAEVWRADAERALTAAQGVFSVNQNETHEAWQRATEEALVAHERARETYEDAMQAAQEHSRDSHERALVELRAQADRGAQRSKRASPHSEEKVRKDHDATLESRVEALEEAARGRGQAVESKRSLEERVAQLEKLNATGLLSSESRLFKLQREGGLAPTQPLPRTFRWESPKAVPPVAPVPALPPSARSSPFMKLRRTQPDAPTPAPGAMRDEERQDMARAMDDLKREAKRLREELARMRAEVERLPRADGTR